MRSVCSRTPRNRPQVPMLLEVGGGGWAMGERIQPVIAHPQIPATLVHVPTRMPKMCLGPNWIPRCPALWHHPSDRFLFQDP